MIDLRSDTVTKPTKGMLNAMFNAQVGDDVFGDDPTIRALEEKTANLFGQESGLFCASGTMTNQLALMVHLNRGEEVIADEMSHIYLYEGGGLMANTGASIKLLNGQNGRITAEQVKSAINNPLDIHQPLSKLVSIENTMNKGGGVLYNFEEIKKIKQVCVENDLAFHLDGARIFNALIETPEKSTDYAIFDSVSICLSKGLGCPVGSVLLGNNSFINKARRIRKRLGGGWRQAGFLAAAGIYALDHHVDRLKEDHIRAKAIGEILKGKSFVKSIYPIPTNIVIFECEMPSAAFVSKAARFGLGCVSFGPNLVRFVTHLDFDDASLKETEAILAKI